MPAIKTIPFLVCFFFCFTFAKAQQDTTILKEVVVAAPLFKSNLLVAPTAISLVNVSGAFANNAQLSLKEYLGSVPGLFAQNQYNYNQDLRISIRGFGARAAFGIRGVQIIVDGIPESTPDGQGQLDNVPLGLIKNIEVLRGPSGALYGNAAGGVLLINTLDSLDSGQQIAIRSMGGSFGLANYQATISLAKDKWSGLVFYNHTQANGFRENAAFKQDLFNAKVSYRASKNHHFIGQFNITQSPYAEDPGGLNLLDAETRPRKAREANLLFKTSEEIQHLKTGLSHLFTFTQSNAKKGSINSYLFGAKRDFRGLLPFENEGVSAFSRDYFGGGSLLSLIHKKASQTLFGFGYASQTDARSRFQNLNGKLGLRSGFQEEKYSNSHAYINHKNAIGPIQWVTAIRFDQIRMGTQTPNNIKNYKHWSPSMSIGYPFKKNQFINLQYAESFETPTLSEASNSPTGSLGFNQDLSPTQTKSFELLYRKKKKLNSGLIGLELSAFISQTFGELLPYELANYPSRVFYENAGKTNRKGLEAQWRFSSKRIEILSAYTYAHYLFKESALLEPEIANKQLPGIPKHHWNTEIMLRLKRNFELKVQHQFVGSLLANNNNSVSVPSYQVFNVSGAKHINTLWGKFKLFGGINNLSNSRYYDNIRINAFAGRYYEPAPTRNLYLGFEVSL